MPTYEYKCGDCGKHFNKFQKITDKPLKKCPECGGTLKKLISSGSGVIFKGKGFYQTDYKSSQPSKNKSVPPCATGGDCSKCKKND